MEWVKAAQGFATRMWVYIDWCLHGELQAPVCRPFWTWVSIALLGIGAIAVAWAAWKILSYRMKHIAALRAEAERARVADEQTMRAFTWEGDNAFPAQDSAEALRLRIKEALTERRNAGTPPPIV
jgi:hypothetical protein